MNKIEAGMYVRTKAGLIFKIEKYLNRENNIQLFYKECKVKTIKNIDEIKTSHNIIDLIEVGDYVNGYLIIKKETTLLTKQLSGIEPSDIKSILTKEQFKSMEYKVGGKNE